MVRKAVRTYSQILAGFAKADEEDARIRAHYEPSAPAPPTRPSPDADPASLKRPVSATRKHRYANVLDWSDDITAIVNVDRHDGGVRPGATATAAAFAADRKGNASRALAAALNSAMETASRLNASTLAATASNPPTATCHTSRLAERLLRATHVPFLASSAGPAGSPSTTPSADEPSSNRSPSPSLSRSSTTAPRQAWGEAGAPPDPSWPGSPLSAGRTQPAIPTGAFDGTHQQPAGSLLHSSARLLYYGSAKPRIRSACRTGAPASASATPGRSRPLSAPAQQQPLPYNYRSSYAGGGGPLTSRDGGGGGLGSSRCSEAGPSATAARNSWAGRASPCPASSCTVGGSGGGSGSTPGVPLRPASAAPVSTTGAVRSPGRRPVSAMAATSPYAASAAAMAAAAAAGSHAFATRRRSATAYVPPPSPPSAAPSSSAPTRPRSSPNRSPRSSVATSQGYGSGSGGGAAAVTSTSGGTLVVQPAPPAAPVSPETIRHLGINPRQLHQMQPKQGPSNGLVVRDPVGAQLVPCRRSPRGRPFSAPPGAAPPPALGSASQQIALQRQRHAEEQEERSGNVSPNPGRSPSPTSRRQRRESSSSGQSYQLVAVSGRGGGEGGGTQSPGGRRYGSPSPQRGTASPDRLNGGAGGGGPSPGRQTYGSVGMHTEDSFRSATSAYTLMSYPSGGSVAIAAAAAAAAATVTAGVTMARRRHSALEGARKALWTEIADAAGVLPYDAQGADADTAAVASAPYLASYLTQQATAGPASGGSSRAHSRSASPDPLSRGLAAVVTAAAEAAVAARAQHLLPQTRRTSETESFGPEASAAYMLQSSLATAAETEAEMAEPGRAEAAGCEPAAAAQEGAVRAATPAEPEATEAAVQPPPSASDDTAAPAALPRLRLPGQGTVLRLHSLLKRTGDDLGAAGGGGGSGGEGGGTPTGAGGGKRVQWGANVTAQLHVLGAETSSASAAAVELSETADRGSGGLGRQGGGGGSFLKRNNSGMGSAGGGGSGGGNFLKRSNSGTGGAGGPGEPGRPPRHPLSVVVREMGTGGDQGTYGAQGSPSNATAQQQHLLSGGLPGKRAGSGTDGGGAGVGDDGDAAATGDNEVDDLPSLEVSTAAGMLDRVRPASAGSAAVAAAAAASWALEQQGIGDGGFGGGGGDDADGAVPAHTQPEFYQMTALVDQSLDVQGWLFNVYLTDIPPGNPVARRCCIAACTTADQHNRLLVPQPSPRPSTANAAASPQTSITPASASQLGPFISPADMLPWVTRPDQLLGHWLRVEAFAIAPLPAKLVDAVTYMGRLDEPAPAAQPRLSKLQVVEVRTAAQQQHHQRRLLQHHHRQYPQQQQQEEGGQELEQQQRRQDVGGLLDGVGTSCQAGEGGGGGSRVLGAGLGSGSARQRGQQEQPGQELQQGLGSPMGNAAGCAAALMQARMVGAAAAPSPSPLFGCGGGGGGAAGLAPGQRPGSARRTLSQALG